MPLILNIETSSEICSVCLSRNGRSLSSRNSTEPNSHSRLLTILIMEVFDGCNIRISELDAVAVSKGPGSYTGLRIGISVAKGICYALKIPLIAVDTLKSLAFNIFENFDRSVLQENEKNNFLIAPLIDARRMEVYSAVFDNELNSLKGASAEVINESSFREILSDHLVLFGGSGASKCKHLISQLRAIFVDNIEASSAYMANLSYLAYENNEFENIAYFEPFYLKEFIPGKAKPIF